MKSSGLTDLTDLTWKSISFHMYHAEIKFEPDLFGPSDLDFKMIHGYMYIMYVYINKYIYMYMYDMYIHAYTYVYIFIY